VFDSVIGVAALLGAVAVLVGAYGQALGYALIVGGVAWICYMSALARPAAPTQGRPRPAEVQPRARRLNPTQALPNEGNHF
jgi:hypothetical protein